MEAICGFVEVDPREYGIYLYLVPFPFARCNLGSEKFFVERDKRVRGRTEPHL